MNRAAIVGQFELLARGRFVSRLAIVLTQNVLEIAEKRRRNYLFLLDRLRGVSAPLFESLPAGNMPLFYPLLVENNTGLLVPPRDAEALARAIGQFLEQPSLGKKSGLAGRERVSKRFALEKMTRATQRLYEGLLERSSRTWHNAAC